MYMTFMNTVCKCCEVELITKVPGTNYGKWFLIYGICTLSTVICIPNGEPLGNTCNSIKGTIPYKLKTPYYHYSLLTIK